MREQWDLYNRHGQPLDKWIQRGDSLLEHEFHLVVLAYIFNHKGQILIQKRSENLNYAPGMWAITGGSAVRGENSEQAIKREIFEELGVQVESVGEPLQFISKNAIKSTYFITIDKTAEEFTLQDEEVSEVKWVDFEELKHMIHHDEFFPAEPAYYESIRHRLNFID